MASCPQCTQGFVLDGEPQGTIMVDGAYFHAAPPTETTDTTSPSRAVVLLTDIFGLPLKNSKLIADALSKQLGCDVWVPDVFAGHPPVAEAELEPLMPQRPGEKMTWTNRLRFVLLALPRIFRFIAVRPAVVDPRVVAFTKKLREEKKYAKIGAVGYCFGGSICIRTGSLGIFDSLVIAHPGGCTLDQIKAINIPSAWVMAEEDMAFSKELRHQAEASFAARKDKPEYVDYEFKDYKGTVHGFAARPNLSIPGVAEAFKGSVEQTVAWFKKTL
ncbi:dienelactone hydrolase endo-1-3,1,4-beta-D-glucanase [Cytidiella melzeri]|nr:dienelactone hydrolase endo-1-3,1,4-beta-D-glucanase [Cytidiella melzeri]